MRDLHVWSRDPDSYYGASKACAFFKKNIRFSSLFLAHARPPRLVARPQCVLCIFHILFFLLFFFFLQRMRDLHVWSRDPDSYYGTSKASIFLNSRRARRSALLARFIVHPLSSSFVHPLLPTRKRPFRLRVTFRAGRLVTRKPVTLKEGFLPSFLLSISALGPEPCPPRILISTPAGSVPRHKP